MIESNTPTNFILFYQEKELLSKEYSIFGIIGHILL